jgi:hypothetical protein
MSSRLCRAWKLLKSSPDYVVQAMSMVESPNIESRLCRTENLQFLSPDYVVQDMSYVKSHIESRLCSSGYVVCEIADFRVQAIVVCHPFFRIGPVRISKFWDFFGFCDPKDTWNQIFSFLAYILPISSISIFDFLRQFWIFEDFFQEISKLPIKIVFKY